MVMQILSETTTFIIVGSIWAAGFQATYNNEQSDKKWNYLLYDIFNHTIKSEIISNCKIGLYIGNMAGIPTVTKNTFKYCGTAVYFYGWEQSPGRLNTFTGNTYIGNKLTSVGVIQPYNS